MATCPKSDFLWYNVRNDKRQALDNTDFTRTAQTIFHERKKTNEMHNAYPPPRT